MKQQLSSIHQMNYTTLIYNLCFVLPSLLISSPPNHVCWSRQLVLRYMPSMSSTTSRDWCQNEQLNRHVLLEGGGKGKSTRCTTPAFPKIFIFNVCCALPLGPLQYLQLRLTMASLAVPFPWRAFPGSWTIGNTSPRRFSSRAEQTGSDSKARRGSSAEAA
jgi:hypothetical protein